VVPRQLKEARHSALQMIFLRNEEPLAGLPTKDKFRRTRMMERNLAELFEEA
jgi:hypothetical protein